MPLLLLIIYLGIVADVFQAARPWRVYLSNRFLAYEAHSYGSLRCLGLDFGSSAFFVLMYNLALSWMKLLACCRHC